MIAWAALTLVLWRMLGKLYQICRSGEMRGVESGAPAGDSCTHGDTGCSDRVVACSWQAASSIGAAAASAPQLAMHSRCEDIPRPLRRAAVGHVRAYNFRPAASVPARRDGVFGALAGQVEQTAAGKDHTRAAGEGRGRGWVLITWNALSQARSADPDEIELSSITSSKRLIFVRHGESTWNYVFNRYDRATPPLHRKAARPILTRPHGSSGRLCVPILLFLSS